MREDLVRTSYAAIARVQVALHLNHFARSVSFHSVLFYPVNFAAFRLFRVVSFDVA